jgi:type I restriction enzyme M protein
VGATERTLGPRFVSESRTLVRSRFMSTKQEVLKNLTRDELLLAVDRFEVKVEDRRAKAALVDAVAGSKKALLADLLTDLPRDRLKELCRAMGLDDSGREKSALVERLSGGKPKAGKASAPPPALTRTMLPEVPDVAGALTVDKLEGYLWAAADILRGSIDSSDYKNFIFGLLFVKRLSDRFDEECETLIAEGHDPEDADEHQFFVPARARWASIQKTATNIGDALNKACSAYSPSGPST